MIWYAPLFHFIRDKRYCEVRTRSTWARRHV